MKKLAYLIAASLLIGCGGGGGGDSTPATPTPAGTAISMATVKGVFMGTATPGTEIRFTLTGSDSQGASWTGSYARVSDGPTTFESQSVTQARTLITLQRGTDTPISDVTHSYFLTSNETLYKSVSSLGITTVPITQTVLPDNIHVGDFDILGTFSSSDGTTTTTTWELQPEFNGNAKLIISGVIKTGATITGTEVDTYYIDQSGTPYKVSISLTISGVTVTLSGE